MYAQLKYNPGSVQPWAYNYPMPIETSLPKIALPEFKKRTAVAVEIVKKLNEPVHGPIYNALMFFCQGLPLGLDVDDIEFCLCMALAHIRLPEARRKEREDLIDRIIAEYFLEAPKNVVPAEAGKTHIKLLAQLVPDAVLGYVVRAQVSQLSFDCMNDPAWQHHFLPALQLIDAARKALGIAPASTVPSPLEPTTAYALMMTTFFSRPPAQRKPYIALLQVAVDHGYGKAAIQSTCAALKGLGLLRALEGDVFANVLTECMATESDTPGPIDIQQIVANQVALGRAVHEMQGQAIVAATVAAMDAGVPFGTKAQALNATAMAAANQARSVQFLLMTPQRLRLRQKLAQAAIKDKSKSTSEKAATPELDPVSAWSVKSLVRWIQGPIAHAEPKPLNHRAIVAEEKAARQEARVKTKSQLKAIDTDLTEDDVKAAVRDALNTSAEFAVWEINGLLQRLQELKIEKTPTSKTCENMVGVLNELMHQPDIDEQKARILLHQAQGAIGLLNKEIQAEEINALTRERFGKCLQIALSQEPMVEGKRHGGVIACPMKRSHWQGVRDEYHGRWLPWFRQVTIDGQGVALSEDQALALYVTQSSLSGYEFDVSVHLWQRRPGCTGAPTTTSELFAPMNMEQWDDTLVPFAVLHVPTAH